VAESGDELVLVNAMLPQMPCDSAQGLFGMIVTAEAGGDNSAQSRPGVTGDPGYSNFSLIVRDTVEAYSKPIQE
jgi:hypothetical protein